MTIPTNRWNQEYEVLKEMQEDRMHFNAAVQCHEKCVSNYWTNSLVFFEKSCMDNCLKKFSQSGIISNMNYNRFEELEMKKAKKK